MSDARISIVNRDCFGIIPLADMPNLFGLFAINVPTPRRAFAFESTSSKVDSFIRWLMAQEDAGVLEIISGRGSLLAGEPWTNVYIESSYQRGMRTGRAQLRAEGVPVPSFEELPGGVSGAMNQPIHADRLKMIYGRTFEELKSVTSVANAAVRRDIADGLSEALARGIAEGKNPITIAQEMARNTTQHLDELGRIKLRRISRTEILNSHNTAAVTEYQNAANILPENKRIVVDILLNASACEICVGLWEDGPYPIDQAMGLVPGSTHPNCVLGDTEITAANVLSAMRAWYDGPVVELAFADGRRLSVTPNHMLLTPTGFARAQSLMEGDDIIDCPDVEGVVANDPDNNRGPVRADEMFESLRESSGVPSSSVPVSAEYLHGDARFAHGNIDVVPTDRFLHRGIHAALGQHFVEPDFDRAGEVASLLGCCDLSAMLGGLSLAADRSMGLLRDTLAERWRGGRIEQFEGGAFTAGSDSALTEPSDDDGPAYSVTLGEREDALATEKLFDDFVNGQFDACGLVTVRARFNLSTARVTGVHVRSFRGYVYDFHTVETSYICNGLVSSNCVCGTAPRVITRNPDGTFPAQEPKVLPGRPKTVEEAKARRLAREKAERKRQAEIKVRRKEAAKKAAATRRAKARAEAQARPLI